MGLLIYAQSTFAQDMIVDGATTESYERSIRAMADSLTEEKRKVFAKGLINLILTRYPPAEGAKGIQLLQFSAAAAEAAHITLDGYTLGQILARGYELAADAEEKGMPTTSEDERRAALRACLQRLIQISNPVLTEGTYSDSVVFSVTNNLSWAISGIRVSYTIHSEGRSVAWEKDDGSVSIAGGIEPGETRQVRLTMRNLPSEAPKDLIAKVQVLDVGDPEYRQLIRDVRILGGNWADQRSDRECG